jgi:hypothetical protein
LFQETLFLVRHPGWTWQALQDAPDDVVEQIRLHDRAIANEAARS